MTGVAFVGTVDSPYVGRRAPEPRRLRAPDPLGHGHHDGVRSVQAQRSRDRRRHGRHLRQRRRAGVLAADGRAGRRASATPRSSSASRVLDLIGAAVLWTLVRERRPDRHRRGGASRMMRAVIQSDPSRLQPRSVDRSRRRRLLHRDVHVRVVSRRADSSLARSRALAPPRTAAQPRESARHARRSRLVRRLGAVPDACRRPSFIWSTPTSSATAARRRPARRAPRCATSTTISSPANEIDGDWSDPIYLNSSGFDPSLFHDDDGRKYLVNMLWDHRPGQNRFAGIVLQEYLAGAAATRRRAAQHLQGHAARSDGSAASLQARRLVLPDHRRRGHRRGDMR